MLETDSICAKSCAEMEIGMDKENAIEVKNITKDFKVYYDKGSELKEKMLFWKRNRYEKRHVLKGISFTVKKGEAIGLVGKNGCGKSTTLKMLTKIIYPDTGSIHPDMSGRENIYTNASIFGLTKKEIDARLDDIIAFSELEDYIDNPVRTYSSGMYMRLAFAVAINVDADILLIDEILAVGDANYQAKCFNKLREIKADGTTIVIVSHSLGQIEQICDRSIWIKDGLIEAEGTPKDVHLKYLDYMNQERMEQAEKEQMRQAKLEREQMEKKKEEERIKKERAKVNSRYGSEDAKFTEIHMYNAKGEESRIFRTGEKMILDLSYHVENKVSDAVFGFGIFRNDALWCYGTNTRIDRISNFDIEKDGKYKVILDDVNLIPGNYWVDITIEYGEGIPVDYYKQAIKFEVVSNLTDVGVTRIPHSWELDVEYHETAEKKEEQK